MTTNTDAASADATADTPDASENAGPPEGSGEPTTPAEDVADGSGNNTAADNAAEGGGS